MSAYLAVELRRQVREDAGNRCGYCLSAEEISGLALQFEHLCPEAGGGQTIRENLWLACRRCNSHKADRVYALDPVSGLEVSLFNPRLDSWTEHFEWAQSGTMIAGVSDRGRATVEALNMNEPLIVAARSLWVQWEVHPPD